MTGPILPAFPIQNFAPVSYQGDLRAVNIWLLSKGAVANNQGQQIVAPSQSKIVNTQMEWGAQYKGQSVSIDLQANNQGVSSILDKICMVYINNVNNVDDVTVYFPDTGMFVTAPAGTAGYYPVFTNLFVCNIYNGYTGQLVNTSSAQQTQILFGNFAVPGFLSQTVNTITNHIAVEGAITAVGSTFGLLAPGNYEIFGITLQFVFGSSIAAGGCAAKVSVGSILQPSLLNAFPCGLGTGAGTTFIPSGGATTSMTFNPDPYLINTPNAPINLNCGSFTNSTSLSFECNIWYNTAAAI